MCVGVFVCVCLRACVMCVCDLYVEVNSISTQSIHRINWNSIPLTLRMYGNLDDDLDGNNTY